MNDVKQIPHPVQVLHLAPGDLPLRLPISMAWVEPLARVSLWTAACMIVNGRWLARSSHTVRSEAPREAGRFKARDGVSPQVRYGSRTHPERNLRRCRPPASRSRRRVGRSGWMPGMHFTVRPSLGEAATSSRSRRAGRWSVAESEARVTQEQAGRQETQRNRENRPATNKITVAVVLLAGVFLAGFLPQYVKVKRLDNELREARQENSMAQLRDLVGLAFFQASQKNYGLAADTSARFFNRTREAINQTPDSSGRKPLEDLLTFRDKITAELAMGDPGVLNDMQALFVKTHQATAPPAATP